MTEEYFHLLIIIEKTQDISFNYILYFEQVSFIRVYIHKKCVYVLLKCQCKNVFRTWFNDKRMYSEPGLMIDRTYDIYRYFIVIQYNYNA